jgi:hypothetical protein
MKKFVVLYMASSQDFEKMMKDSTPEQQSKGMDAWMNWMDANKKSIVDAEAPLGKTKRVDSKGSSGTKNEIGGYSIRLCRPNRLVPQRSYSAKITPICKCRALG